MSCTLQCCKPIVEMINTYQIVTISIKTYQNTTKSKRGHNATKYNKNTNPMKKRLITFMLIGRNLYPV